MLDIFYFIHHRGDHVHDSLFYRCAFIFYLLRVILCTDDGLRIALLLWIDLILYNKKKKYRPEKQDKGNSMTNHLGMFTTTPPILL